MHDFESFLMSPCEPDVSPQMLKVYGKRAALAYMQDGTPLNESVRGFVKEAKLNPEQTKRVIESANNETYMQLFRKGFQGNIEFPLADPSVVLSTAGAAEAGAEKTASYYQESTYVHGGEGLDPFADLALPLEKTASVEETVSTDRDVLAAQFLANQEQLHSATMAREAAYMDFVEKTAQLGRLLEEAADSNRPDELTACIEAAKPNEKLASVIFSEFPHLLAPQGSLQKLAMMGAQPMMPNPITGVVQELESVSGRLVETQMSLQQLQMANDHFLALMRGPQPLQPAAAMFPQQQPPMPGMPPKPGRAQPGMPPQQGMPPPGPPAPASPAGAPQLPGPGGGAAPPPGPAPSSAPRSGGPAGPGGGTGAAAPPPNVGPPRQ